MRDSSVQEGDYRFSSYVDKGRWISYWHQLDEVLAFSPDSLLEVGIGLGIFSMVARKSIGRLVTVDIDPALGPDHVASVTRLPFEDGSFDVAVCFQVLEHIPFDDFSNALSELARVARNGVIVSLPDARSVWLFFCHFPLIGKVRFAIPRPRLRPRVHVFDGQHLWEINKAGYSLKRVVQTIEELGLEVCKTYRVPEHPYHRFFVLRQPT